MEKLWAQGSTLWPAVSTIVHLKTYNYDDGKKTPGWKRLYILIAFPLAAGAVFVFAQPKVDAALQTVVVRQAAMCDSSSLNMSVSAADYAGLAPGCRCI